MNSKRLRQSIICVIVFAISVLLMKVFIEFGNGYGTISEDATVVLWWKPFGSDDQFRDCGDFRCFFTQNRAFISHENLKAVLFYGSDFEINDLPIPRGKDVKWGLLHEESPKNNFILVHEDALRLFNFSATFSRFSDVPLTLLHLPGIQMLSDKTYFRSTSEKNRLIQAGLAPALYIQSDCDTINDRDSYILELMKYMNVDSYGTCLNTRSLPKSLKYNYINNLNSNEFRSFVGQYKFTLAFENAVCNDYITEKLWRPLIVGSIPVYYGSPSFKDWLPNNLSAIAVENFPEPRSLAKFLLDLVENDEKYEQYLRHKFDKYGITNLRLMNELEKRSKTMFDVFDYQVRSFECFVCKNVDGTGLRTLKKEQYNCEKPKSILRTAKMKENWWLDAWNSASCSAKIMVRYVSENKSISLDGLEREKKRMQVSNECIRTIQ